MQDENKEIHDLTHAKDLFLITAVCVAVGLVIAFVFGYLEPSDLYSASYWLTNQ